MFAHGLPAQYSDINKAAVSLSKIPRLMPRSAQPDARGNVLLRHNGIEAQRRPEGMCAAEATEMGTNRQDIADAVAKLKRKPCGGIAIGDVNDVYQRFGFELCAAGLQPARTLEPGATVARAFQVRRARLPRFGCRPDV